LTSFKIGFGDHFAARTYFSSNNPEKLHHTGRYTGAASRAMRSNPMKKLNYGRITTTIEREWLLDHRWDEEDRGRQAQAALDEALREGLSANRIAPAERHESASARNDGA